MSDTATGASTQDTGAEPGGALSRRAIIGLGAAGATAALASRLVLPDAALAAAAPKTATNTTTTPATVGGDGDTGSDLQGVATFGYAGTGPGGGPAFDRIRLLTAKLPKHGTITAGGTAGSTSITLGFSAAGLQPSQPMLVEGGGNPEIAYTAASYVAGSNPVALAGPLQQNGRNWVIFDTAAATGPRATDMTGFGIQPVGCVISEGLNGLYTMMIGAGADQGPPINTVMMSPSLVSGPAAQMDRQRSLGAGGDGLGTALASQPSSTPASAVPAADNQAATVTFAGVAGQRHRLTMLAASYNATPVAGSLTVVDGATTVFAIDMTSAGTVLVPLPPGGIAGTSGQPLTITLSAAGTGVTGKLSVAKLTT